MVLDMLYVIYAAVKLPKLATFWDLQAVQEMTFLTFAAERVLTGYVPYRVYLLWQIPGNIWFWSCHGCFATAPVLSSVVLSYLLFAYLLLLVPMLTLLFSCVCAPCLLLVAISMVNSKVLAGSESVIGSLKVEKGIGRGRCVVCSREMASDQPVIDLNCGPSHIFHEKCLKRWLRLSLTCPICSTPLLRPVS